MYLCGVSVYMSLCVCLFHRKIDATMAELTAYESRGYGEEGEDGGSEHLVVDLKRHKKVPLLLRKPSLCGLLSLPIPLWGIAGGAVHLRVRLLLAGVFQSYREAFEQLDEVKKEVCALSVVFEGSVAIWEGL